MRRVWSYRFRRTTLTLLFCLAVLGGVGAARLGFVPPAGWGLAAPMLWPAVRQQGVAALLIIVLIGTALGGWHGSLYMRKLADYDSLYGQTVTLTVQAAEDAVYGPRKQLTFTAGNVVMQNGQKLIGNIKVSGFGQNAIFQGDAVQVSGKLYPSHGSELGRMSFAKLDLLAVHPSRAADFRRRFAAGMQTALPEPLASFAMGLLIGQRSTLPDTVKQDLLMVGLTHIIAVSGYNLTIILRASQRLAEGHSKHSSTLLGLVLVAVFLMIAGTSASIVRAAIVSTLSIIAGYYGRAFKPLNLLALAAVITVWAKPLYLWGDISWYLSFLAFFGVMVLAPLVQRRWPGRWLKSIVGSVALESICAEVMSMPFILYVFGQMSLVGLPANVLVVALIPLAMLLSLVAGLAGMLAAPLAGWFAWPAQCLLNYMLDIAHLMAGLPHVFLSNLGLPLTTMLGFYGLVVILAWILHHKTKAFKGGTITEMNKPETTKRPV